MSQNSEHLPVNDRTVRDISTWVRKYAENRRGLTVVIGLLIFFGISVAIAGGSYVGGQAYRSGNWPLAAIAITCVAVACLATLFLSLTSVGRTLPDRIARRFVGDEGETYLSCPTAPRRLLIACSLAIAFAVCILLQVFFGDAMPNRFRQPVSALYAIPVLISIWLLQRPTNGYLGLLWPALFGLHAVCLLLGAPILFTGRWVPMNFVVPIAGYGILTHLCIHLYGRFALHKVKQLAAGGRATQ